MSEQVAATTVFSLHADLPTVRTPLPDTGAGELDAAWLVSEDDKVACHLRKFSAAGTTLRLDDSVDLDTTYVLQLVNGQCIAGSLSWVEGNDAGFLFDAPIDVVGTLARNLALLPAERRRVPRVELPQTVGVRLESQFEFARTRDLSQAGVGIETKLELVEDGRVEVAFDGLPPLTGTVRWARAGKAGIAFDQEISWQTLMPWLRQAQRTRPNGSVNASVEGGSFNLLKEKHVVRLNTAARVREGSRWWNVQVRNLTTILVEFDCAMPLAKGTQLWLWLPGFTGWPVTVIEQEGQHYLAQFRLPLRGHDLAQLTPRAAAR